MADYSKINAQNVLKWLVRNIQHYAYTEVEADFKSLIQSKDEWPLELLTQK